MVRMSTPGYAIAVGSPRTRVLATLIGVALLVWCARSVDGAPDRLHESCHTMAFPPFTDGNSSKPINIVSPFTIESGQRD